MMKHGLSHSMIAVTLAIAFFHCHAFIHSTTTFWQYSTRNSCEEWNAFPAKRVVQLTRISSKNDDNSNNDSSLDDFLDKPFFDPDKYDETDDNSSAGPLAWFANLVKTDYELAETLYAGSFFFILVVITQELLRMQLYGDRYIPFTRLGPSAGGGNLF